MPRIALPDVTDPAGAGDAFAGAFMAVLTRSGEDPGLVELRQALRTAAAVASFAVERTSVEAFAEFSSGELERRLVELDRGPETADGDPVNVEGGSDVLQFPGRDDPQD